MTEIKKTILRINLFSNSKEELIFFIKNGILIGSFYFPIILIVILSSSNWLIWIGLTMVVVAILLGLFNRVSPNARLLIDDNQITIMKSGYILEYQYFTIDIIEVYFSNDHFWAPVIFKLKFKDSKEVIFNIDKFYFMSPKKQSKRVILILNGHVNLVQFKNMIMTNVACHCYYS